MSAVFGTPVAAALFGVELLAFEFKPRSMVLIGLAAATADGVCGWSWPRRPGLAAAALPRAAARAARRRRSLLGAAAVGIACGLAAWVHDPGRLRRRGPVQEADRHLHWMWWPAIGGLIIGVGGLIDPRALGVGYDTIHAELLGQLAIGALASCSSSSSSSGRWARLGHQRRHPRAPS